MNNFTFRLAVYYAEANRVFYDRTVKGYEGDPFILSRDLAKIAGVHETVVRRDLGPITEGKRGSGYSADRLSRDLHRALRGHVGAVKAESKRIRKTLDLVDAFL